MSMIPDFWGGVIGMSSVCVILLLWKYAHLLENGNVDRLEKEERQNGHHDSYGRLDRRELHRTPVGTDQRTGSKPSGK